VSECDREASIVRRLWTTRGCCVIEKKSLLILSYNLELPDYALSRALATNM
jgi:hypothetical protein